MKTYVLFKFCYVLLPENQVCIIKHNESAHLICVFCVCCFCLSFLSFLGASTCLFRPRGWFKPRDLNVHAWLRGGPELSTCGYVGGLCWRDPFILCFWMFYFCLFLLCFFLGIISFHFVRMHVFGMRFTFMLICLVGFCENMKSTNTLLSF